MFNFYLFLLLYTSHGFKASLIIRWLIDCFKTLFLNSFGTQAHMPGVAQSHCQGFMNFLDTKFPSVSNSSVDKSFNKLVKKCYGIGFLKFTHSLKKSIACVNIAKL
jgi:hypothetical protein